MSNPRYPAALSNLGRAYLKLHRSDDARHCFEQTLALQPDNVTALNQLGNALFDEGKILEADQYYRRALPVQPDHAETHYNLARVCVTQGRWQEAAASLRTSLAYNAASAKAYGALGDVCYCHLGNLAEALHCYRQVLVLTPNDAKARLLVDALSGALELTQVPAGYVAATYEPLAERFDQVVEQRGDRSPDWLKAALEPASDLAVLDLGCGTGLCGLAFRPWASTLVGVDLSANMLARARAAASTMN